MSFTQRKVRVALKRQFSTQPVDTMRGTVTSTDDNGISIRGRHFQETKGNINKVNERPLSKNMRSYFVPFSSIRYIQVIEEGTESYELDIEVNNNEVLKNPLRNCILEP